MKAWLILPIFSFISACATKTICANGNESFRPVLDPANACKVRIRQVIVGSDIPLPPSIAVDSGSVNWVYAWSPGELRNGQVELGHIILKPEGVAPNLEKK